MTACRTIKPGPTGAEDNGGSCAGGRQVAAARLGVAWRSGAGLQPRAPTATLECPDARMGREGWNALLREGELKTDSGEWGLR